MIDFNIKLSNNIIGNKIIKIDDKGHLINQEAKENEKGIKINDIIALTKAYLDQMKKYEEKENQLLKEWEQDKENTEFYNKKFISLENAIDILYKYYYENVHAILSDEEINQIQKEINYNFMSDKFYNKMIEKLESKAA